MRKAFTLVELLIVIAIIAILAAIAIPQYNKYKERAYVVSMKSDAKQIIESEEAYMAQHDKYFVTTTPTDTSNYDQVTYDTTTNEIKDTNGNVLVKFSDGNSLDGDIEENTCSDGSPGYKFTIKNAKTNKEVTFDSCKDSAPQES